MKEESTSLYIEPFLQESPLTSTSEIYVETKQKKKVLLNVLKEEPCLTKTKKNSINNSSMENFSVEKIESPFIKENKKNYGLLFFYLGSILFLFVFIKIFFKKEKPEVLYGSFFGFFFFLLLIISFFLYYNSINPFLSLTTLFFIAGLCFFIGGFLFYIFFKKNMYKTKNIV